MDIVKPFMDVNLKDTLQPTKEVIFVIFKENKNLKNLKTILL